MRRKIIILGSLLILGHGLTESYRLAMWIWPNYATMNLNLFLDHNFKLIPGLNILYYFKLPAEDFLYCVYSFVGAMIAKEYSLKLFIICSICLLYHIVDAAFFWINYKTSHLLYWIMLAAFIASIIVLLLPMKHEDKSGKVIWME